MLKDVMESILRLVEAIFGYTAGEPDFNIVLGVCIFAWVLAARIFMAIFSSKRGIFSAFFAFAIPMLLGLIGYAMAELFIVPLVSKGAGWSIYAIPSAIWVLFIFLSIVVFAKRIWSLPSGVSLFIYIVATAAAIGVYFGAQVTLGVIEYGEGQLEQRDRSVKSDLESFM